MKKINFSQMLKLSAAEVSEYVPMIVTFNGEDTFIIDKVDSVIGLSDLHPRVRAQLKALEEKARRGMPPAEKLDLAPSYKESKERSNQKEAIIVRDAKGNIVARYYENKTDDNCSQEETPQGGS